MSSRRAVMILAYASIPGLAAIAEGTAQAQAARPAPLAGWEAFFREPAPFTLDSPAPEPGAGSFDPFALDLPPSTAQSGAGGLEVFFAVYAWLPMQTGDVTVRGVEGDVDLGFSDVIDLLDDLQGGFMGHLEIGWKPFTLIADLYYINLEDERNLPGGELEMQFIQDIVDVVGAYRVGEWKLTGDRALALDAFAGARWNYLYSELDPNALILTNRVSRDFDWFDAVFGARALLPLSDCFLLTVRGDLGGFGWGESSDFTWQAAGALTWHGDHWSLGLGYRALGIDYDRGSGSGKFEYDITLHGPFVGLGYRF